MKKAVVAVIFLAMTFFLIWTSLIYAQSGKSSDTEKKAQEGVAPKGQDEAAAQADQYIIGPEDVLLIYVWKEEALTKQLPVRMDGKISLPLVDDIQAAGLSPLQLKDALTQKLTAFIDNPVVTVTVMEPNSYKVYVSGEVKKPGVHKIHGDMTLIKLITLADGFTEWANQKNILIITKEKGAEKRKTVNYKKIVEGDEPDVSIQRGDTVIVR